ncbi:hypothetical protein WM40_23830 [Robbsia andropogonis]|uniref:Uncharacterized protein n=1 Tax=Robbsia andropogonis TaxID=28092 RepID=A0A0F5JUJ5_9BURK|nr:hypothetical protein [Robbsia andropogonis]KKB61330.1 hypothetical protein WM40_23830 [Robbsia andropogonis]
MANLTRVDQKSLQSALNGDSAVADAIGNAINGSSMNSFSPDPTNGSGSGMYAQIGTLNYVEMTITLSSAGNPTVSLPFTHQSLSSQYGVIPGVSASGVAVNALVPPGSAQAKLYRYDGTSLDAGTYYLGGCYESEVG